MLQKHAKIVTGVLNLDGASPKAYHSCIRTMEEFGMAKKVLPTVLALIPVSYTHLLSLLSGL